MLVVPIILFIIGGLLNLTVIGMVIGVPLCFISFWWFVIALVRRSGNSAARREKRDDQRTQAFVSAVAAAARPAASAPPPPAQPQNASMFSDIHERAQREPPFARATPQGAAKDSPPFADTSSEPEIVPPTVESETKAAFQEERPDATWAKQATDIPNPAQWAAAASMSARQAAGALGEAQRKMPPLWPVLYAVLAALGVLFIPEARNWVIDRTIESQAAGTEFWATTRVFAAEHQRFIWECTALVAVAIMFVRFGRVRGLAGVVGCLALAAYLSMGEFELNPSLAGLLPARTNLRTSADIDARSINGAVLIGSTRYGLFMLASRETFIIVTRGEVSLFDVDGYERKKCQPAGSAFKLTISFEDPDPYYSLVPCGSVAGIQVTSVSGGEASPAPSALRDTSAIDKRKLDAILNKAAPLQ
jgi:hypothetical protein